jgi:hypothetical protein
MVPEFTQSGDSQTQNTEQANSRENTIDTLHFFSLDSRMFYG